MNKLAITTIVVALFSTTSAFAADVTVPLRGKVTAISPTKITISKNQGRFVREIAIDPATKAPADLKVGDFAVVQTKFVAMGIAKLPTPKAAAGKNAALPAAATAPATKAAR